MCVCVRENINTMCVDCVKCEFMWMCRKQRQDIWPVDLVWAKTKEEEEDEEERVGLK